MTTCTNYLREADSKHSSISWKLKIFNFILNLCKYSVKDIKTFKNFEG